MPTYMIQAVLATLFCFMPLGLVAMVYSARVQAHLEHGDYGRARDCSEKARTWCWWSLGVAAAFTVLFFLFVLTAFNVTFSSHVDPTL